jgi:serine/threonine-protein kinase
MTGIHVVAKFEAEARAIARLDHPNVLKIYDVVGEGDARGIVMELLEGEDVLEYLSAEGGRVEPQDALRIVRQAAAGLQAAHAKGIIHRDVKPQNLVILEDGTVKVVDFGLATQSNSSLTAERIGTPHYMSPEACAARPAETGSDVYSLGISLFHLLTGAPPYAGQSVKGILASHAEAKPLYPEKVVRGLAPALGELVRGMTKRDPLTRTSLDDVLATIDRIGGDALVQQLRLKPKKARHHRAAAARARAKSTGPIVLVVGIAVVVGLVLVLARRGDTPPPTRTPPPTAPIEPTVPTPSPSATDPAATPPGMEEPTAPPPETPEQRNQRLAREQAEKKAACETEFREAEAFARANEGEVERIVRKYQAIAHAYPTFDLGKEARRRAEGIRKGEVHPHPDKKFAEKSAVETAKEKWTTLRAQIEAALPTKRYDEALALMPATVEDPDRKLAVELDMWRAMLHKLNGFFALLEKELASVPAAERVLETDTAKGKIARLSTAGPALVTPAGTIEVRWADVTAASIAALATRAFEGKDAALQESLACFAWAHKLRETFYGAAIAVKMGGGTGPDVDLVSTLLGRATERFPR